jgi:hypothetical protein
VALWAWLALAWVVLAVLAAVAIGRAVRMAERRDWLRLGRPERRGAQHPDLIERRQPPDHP